MPKSISALAIIMIIVTPACEIGSDPGDGIDQTWDEVITRWIGQHKEDLYLEPGSPNLHRKEAEYGSTEMARDMTIDRLPGQADAANTLPVYGRVDFD